MFLPQKPYIPIGTLRDAVTYPAAAGTYTDEAIRDALRSVTLEKLVERLDEERNWSLSLSGGEQQRLAVARALLYRPDWLFLDEATSAMDEAGERLIYELLRERLEGNGHRQHRPPARRCGLSRAQARAGARRRDHGAGDRLSARPARRPRSTTHITCYLEQHDVGAPS